MENTGLMLSEIQGPLKNLLDNLSGKHGDYWFTALKKMLQKEEMSNPPEEVLRSLDPLRISAKEKLEKLAEYIRTIPVIHKVVICEIEEDGDLLNIHVLPNLRSFIEGEIDSVGDSPIFCLKKDYKVYGYKILDSDCTDETFDEFCRGKDYESISDFCNAMIELGKRYEKAVPEVSL